MFVVRPLVALVLVMSIICWQHGPEPDRPATPTLTLPELSVEESQVPDYPLWNSLRAWHYMPEMVRPLMEVWEALSEPPLDLRTTMMLAAVTDSRNRCPYCLSSAVCLLQKEGLQVNDILSLQRDIADSHFSEKEKTLLLLAEEMTTAPSRSHQRVPAALSEGWTEREVAHAIFVVGYFNMLNRISEAFALPSDEDHVFAVPPEFPMRGCAGEAS